MGNVDTKLNFRKAIVQLGTKDRVSLLTTKHIFPDEPVICEV